jgi:hypothetical protein
VLEDTGTPTVIENGTLVIQGNRIAAVGRERVKWRCRLGPAWWT